MNLLDLLSSFLFTLVVHGTVLLGAAWLAERAGWLRHTGWAEFAWRTALFGALLSASLAVVLPVAKDALLRMTAVPDATALSESGLTSSLASKAKETTSPGRHLVERSANSQRTTDRTQASSEAESAVIAATQRAPAEALAGVASTGVSLRPDALALPHFIAALVLLAWLVGISVGLLRLALQGVALRRLGRATRQSGAPANAQLTGLSHRLAGELGIAPPTLRVSRHANSPMVLPGAEVLLPEWTSSLDATQQRALLAHELSHLQRRDPTWRIAQRLALLPLFFHPLARHARHRLEALAEDACDARAVQLLGTGRPLAECLATCLSHAGARAGHPALAVAMAGESGPVLRRVQNLLEESRMSLHPPSPALRRGALVLALAALVALPGIAVTTVAAEGLGDSISRFTLSTDNTLNFRSRENGYELRVKMVGKVDFNPGLTDVTHLGKGAQFMFGETRDGIERELRYFGKDGVIQREYRVDGDVQAIDAAGRAWLAKAMPTAIRETGINAEARGKQMLATGGPDKLLAEIALIKSDSAAARYFAVLFGNAKLDAAQMTRALTLAKGIDSDFELRQALQSALGSQTLATELQVQVLTLSNQIGSDFEQAELLITLAEGGDLHGDVLDAWRIALGEIGSDFEQRRVIEALMDRRDATPAMVVVALDSAHGISSDFETREVLTAAAPHLGKSAPALAAYLRLAKTISSDFEMREGLVALIEAGPLGAAAAHGILDTLPEISSDFEAGEVLKSLARAMPNDRELIERYRAAARGLGDFERGQAEKALDRFVSAN